jgi:beta-barrel assembly-enhancing protease
VGKAKPSATQVKRVFVPYPSAWENGLPALVIIVVLILFFNPKLLSRIGLWLGWQLRKPVRQAKWIWSWAAGTEDELLRAERDYGEECARAFVKQFSGSALRTDQEIVATVGSRLAHAVEDPRREFHFTVVSSALSNAFALPGGFVFITESLLALCKHDRGEIAFFLGHEIGHILCGHARDQLTASTLLNAVMTRIPAAGQVLRQMVSKGYARTLELEADREAVRLMSAAGFDGHASIRALMRLAQVSPENSGLAEYFSSHPSLSERALELEQYLRAAAKKPATPY